MTTTVTTETRPWGSFTILDEHDLYKAKRIEVLSSQKLSLQSHEKRKELWVIVQGTGVMTLGDSSFPVGVGDTITIEIGQKHRIENCGSDVLTFIEVQTGTYFGEDDIIRYEDIYNRV